MGEEPQHSILPLSNHHFVKGNLLVSSREHNAISVFAAASLHTGNVNGMM